MNIEIHYYILHIYMMLHVANRYACYCVIKNGPTNWLIWKEKCLINLVGNSCSTYSTDRVHTAH